MSITVSVKKNSEELKIKGWEKISKCNNIKKTKQKTGMRAGKTVTFQWINLTNTTLLRWSRSVSQVIGNIDSKCQVTWWKWYFISVVLYPKTHIITPVDDGKTWDRSWLGYYIKHVISIPQNYQGHQKQGKSEKRLQSRGALRRHD